MTDKRFACSHCGQHFAADASWREEPVVCSACGRSFLPGALPSGEAQPPDDVSAEAPSLPPTAPPRLEEPAVLLRENITALRPESEAETNGAPVSYRGAVVLGLVTPILLVAAMTAALGAWIFAIVLCPLVGYYVSFKLCQWVGEAGGRPAFQRYVASALLSFLLCGGLLVALPYLSRGSDGGEFAAALLFLYGLIALGSAFVCWVIAAIRCWIFGVP